MNITYYPETDSLYIDLSKKSSVKSTEISEGIVLDYDDNNYLVGIDIACIIHEFLMLSVCSTAFRLPMSTLKRGLQTISSLFFDNLVLLFCA